MPTHFYKEREYTAKALEVCRARFLDLCSTNKDQYFFVKYSIDQSNKFYMVRMDQTLTCIDGFNVWVPLGFGTSSCSCIGRDRKSVV